VHFGDEIGSSKGCFRSCFAWVVRAIVVHVIHYMFLVRLLSSRIPSAPTNKHSIERPSEAKMRQTGGGFVAVRWASVIGNKFG
jgi:hypothetical protein